jgi:hypothetical protein
MIKMVKVFVNQNQQLTQEQERILTEKFGTWEVVSVPNRGMSPEEAKEYMRTTRAKNCPAVFFPDSSACILLAVLAYWSGFDYGNSFFGSQSRGDVYFFVFENNTWHLRDLTDLL